MLKNSWLISAHKAAHPERYPVRDHVKAMLPNLKGIEDRFGPTKVHLQIYDGQPLFLPCPHHSCVPIRSFCSSKEVCHVLPLYSMTTPAKYCFRCAVFALCSATASFTDSSHPPTSHRKFLQVCHWSPYLGR